MKHVVHQGNVFSIVPTLPDNSIDCLISSPPYYNLRNYNIPLVIIGGDKDCTHEWIESNSKANLRFRGKNSYIGNNK